MTHTLYVAAAYGASALALGALVIWILADTRNARRELVRLEQAGVRRRSDTVADRP